MTGQAVRHPSPQHLVVPVGWREANARNRRLYFRETGGAGHGNNDPCNPNSNRQDPACRCQRRQALAMLREGRSSRRHYVGFVPATPPAKALVGPPLSNPYGASRGVCPPARHT